MESERLERENALAGRARCEAREILEEIKDDAAAGILLDEAAQIAADLAVAARASGSTRPRRAAPTCIDAGGRAGSIAAAACRGPSSPRPARSSAPPRAARACPGPGRPAVAASESAVGTVSALLRYSQLARRRSSLALRAPVMLSRLTDGRLRLLHALHVAVAVLARTEAHLVHAARHRLLGARREPEGIHMLAQQLRIADDGEIDVAARSQRDSRKFGRRFVLDGAAFGVQIAHRRIGHDDLLAQRFEAISVGGGA